MSAIDGLRAVLTYKSARCAGAEGEAGADQAMHVDSMDAAAILWVETEIRCREVRTAPRQPLKTPGIRCGAAL